MQIKKYIITAAQNDTAVHEDFFASMQTFCKAEHAELIVVPYRYRNPTAPGEGEGDAWADEVVPYLAARIRRAKDVTTTEPRVRKLAKDLTVFADISVRPTAGDPLSGFDGYAGKSSGIFGHAKRALKVIATGTRTPRVMYTTSSCTLPNYSDTKEGKKARFHHVIGALVVEVDKDGTWFARHVSADRKGAFIDLDTKYTPEGSEPAPAALTLTLGDYHCGQEDEAVLEATRRLAGALSPRYTVLHDFLDFRVRNHHEARKLRSKFSRADQRVEDEVKFAAETLRNFHEDFGKLVVVRSNHDEAFERWMDEHEDRLDPVNAPYYHKMWERQFTYKTKHGKFPNLFEMECRRLGVPKRVRFLGRNDSFCVGDVEHAFHGDKGINMPKGGSTRAYARLGVKVTKGHDHTPGIVDGVYSVGITARLDQGYNTLPSTWMNAHVILHADGKRQIVIIRNGKYRAGDKAQIKRAAA